MYLPDGRLYQYGTVPPRYSEVAVLVLRVLALQTKQRQGQDVRVICSRRRLDIKCMVRANPPRISTPRVHLLAKYVRTVPSNDTFVLNHTADQGHNAGDPA